MELNWLEDFLALVETGNFSRAAENRNVTQPAFSRRIRALEDWAGVTLFDRSSQPVRLTPAGGEFMPGAREALRRLAQARDEARQAEQAETATLSFAATQALSLTFFPQWLRGLEVAARVGAIRLLSGSMQAGEDVLLQGQSQFLLCHGHAAMTTRLLPDRFQYRVLAQDRLLPLRAASSDFSGADGSIPYLAYAEESGLGRIVSAALTQRIAARMRPVFISPLASVLQAMARDGRGIAWLPESLAAADLAEGRLVMAGDPQWIIPVEIRLYRPCEPTGRIAEDLWSALQKT